MDYYPVPMWETNEEFGKLFNGLRTIVTQMGCYHLYNCVRQVMHLDGNMAEVGVFTGGTSKLFATIAPYKTLFSYDTFAGLPEIDKEHDNFHYKGQYASDYNEVKAYLSDNKNIQLFKAVFPEKSEIMNDEKFCFVHIDVDLYKPYKDCLNFFYSRMVVGGIIVLDDYGWNSALGATDAVNEFFSNKDEPIFYYPTGQGWIVKK